MAQDLIERFTALHYHAGTVLSGWARWRLRFGHRCVQFPQGGSYRAEFSSVWSSLYNDSGILATLIWTGPDALAGVEWTLAFDRNQGDVSNLASESYGTARSVVAAAPVAANRAVYSQVTFASDEIDGLRPLESYRLKVSRSDAVAMDAFLYRVFLQNLT